MNCLSISNQTVAFIEEKCRGTEGAIIGISGGVDSAVVAELAKRALGHQRVKGALLPCGVLVDKISSEFVESLNIPYAVINIEPTVNRLINGATALILEDKLVRGNAMARVRMLYLYMLANAEKKIVLGTTNKTEWQIGYFTKYGDGACDLEPIINLYKTEVWELARYIGIPTSITERVPTAGLYDGQTDEGEIGVSYPVIDSILKGEVKSGAEFDKIQALRKASWHKRSGPIGCELK